MTLFDKFYLWLLSTQGYMLTLGLILTVAAAGIAITICKICP